MTTVANLKVSVGNPLSLEEISSLCPVYTEREIIAALKAAAKKHKLSFGVEVFKLQYVVEGDGLVIIPGPAVGIVDCGFFRLTFEPKFSGISVGKCLAFAQIAGAVELVNHSETIVEQEVSYDSLTSSIDYFSKAFLSSVYDVLQQGLITTRVERSRVDSEARGNIDFFSTISGASEFPVIQVAEQSCDLSVNRFIKGAIAEVLKSKACNDVKGLAGELLNVFNDVADQIPDIKEINLSSHTTLQRNDYEKCITLAQIIFDGFNYESGDENSFTPYFTINLDLLFERLVSQQLQVQILPENFEVNSQFELEHPASPPMHLKVIKPDIVVSPKDSSLGYKNVVVDSKNKYSMSGNDQLSVSNSDLYQMTYYAQCFQTNCAVLVYPGNKKNCSKYPIQSAEGRAVYEKKRAKAVEKIRSNSKSYVQLAFEGHSVDIYFWRVDLTGTMKETEHSFAQLALFLTDLSKNELV